MIGAIVDILILHGSFRVLLYKLLHGEATEDPSFVIEIGLEDSFLEDNCFLTITVQYIFHGSHIGELITHIFYCLEVRFVYCHAT